MKKNTETFSFFIYLSIYSFIVTNEEGPGNLRWWRIRLYPLLYTRQLPETTASDISLCRAPTKSQHPLPASSRVGPSLFGGTVLSEAAGVFARLQTTTETTTAEEVEDEEE